MDHREKKLVREKKGGDRGKEKRGIDKRKKDGERHEKERKSGLSRNRFLTLETVLPPRVTPPPKKSTNGRANSPSHTNPEAKMFSSYNHPANHLNIQVVGNFNKVRIRNMIMRMTANLNMPR